MITQAIDSPQLTEPLRKKTQQVLCKLCGLCQLLPTECVLGDELAVTEVRVGSGGFADVWQGSYWGIQVAIKQLRVYGEDNFTKTYRASCPKVQQWPTALD
jgi:hypothetical protein